MFYTIQLLRSSLIGYLFLGFVEARAAYKSFADMIRLLLFRNASQGTQDKEGQFVIQKSSVLFAFLNIVQFYLSLSLSCTYISMRRVKFGVELTEKMNFFHLFVLSC